MASSDDAFDWTHARAFLAAAQEGSFSAAARALGATQPTVSRQVAALEAAFGVTLFERVGAGLTITPSGLELLEHARAMGEAATAFALAAGGQAQAVEGQVRISATDMVAAYRLPKLLPRLRAIAPRVTIEIVAANAVSDLLRREADIAIRHVRPEQPDLIARRLPDVDAHLYASTDYLDRAGRPRTIADLSTHDVIAYTDPDRAVTTYQGLGLPIRREQIRCASENGVVLIEMLRQGLGLSMMTADAVEPAPELERVLPDHPATPVPVWLVTHRELNTSRRIRIVFDALVEAFGERPQKPL